MMMHMHQCYFVCLLFFSGQFLLISAKFYIYQAILLMVYNRSPLDQNQLLMQGEEEVIPYEKPPQWAILQFRQKIVSTNYSTLREARRLLQQINRIKTYVDDGVEPINQHIEQNLSRAQQELQLQNKQSLLTEQIRLLIYNFELSQVHQREISRYFLDAMQIEVQEDMQELRLFELNKQGENKEYVSYIKEQLYKGLATLKAFLQQQERFFKDYTQTSEFMRQLEQVRQEYTRSIIATNHLGNQQNRDAIIQEDPANQQLIILPRQQFQSLSLKFRQLINIIGNNLTEIYRDNIKQQGALSCIFACLSTPIWFKCICFSLILLPASGLGWLAYKLAAYDHYEVLSECQQLWRGVGAYLAYLWGNCYLANYCYSRQINILLGMGCRSPQEILFYRPIWVIVLLFLTIFYVAFLIWAQYKPLGLAINILVVAIWIAQLIFRLFRMCNISSFVSKFSLLHYFTLIVPINDIISSLLVYVQTKDDYIISRVVYLVITAISVGVLFGKWEMKHRQYRLQRNQQQLNVRRQQQANMRNQEELNVSLIMCLIVTLIIQLINVFVRQPELSWTKVLVAFGYAFNLILIGLYVTLQRQPLTIVTLLNEIKPNCIDDNGGNYQLIKANSYPAAIRKTFAFISVLYLLSLPVGVHCEFFQAKIGLFRYLYVGLTLLGYFIWSFYYLNEVGVSLKHPLSNHTRFGQAARLLDLDYDQKYDLMNKRFTENQFKFNAQDMFKRDEALENLDIASKKVQEDKIKQIRDILEDSITIKLIEVPSP